MGLFNRKNKINEKRMLYEKERDKLGFRYKSLHELLGENKGIVGIDTNLMDKTRDYKVLIKGLCKYLDGRNIIYRKLPIVKKNTSSIFGMKLEQKGESTTAYAVILELTKNQLSEELFYEFLSHSDLMIGLAPNESFNNIVEELEFDYDIAFPQRHYFKGYVYDSMNFSVIRTGSNGLHS